jgi:uncharacterized paraquat-inducible protein A
MELIVLIGLGLMVIFAAVQVAKFFFPEHRAATQIGVSCPNCGAVLRSDGGRCPRCSTALDNPELEAKGTIRRLGGVALGAASLLASDDDDDDDE